MASRRERATRSVGGVAVGVFVGVFVAGRGEGAGLSLFSLL